MKKDTNKSNYFPDKKISETLLEFYKPFLDFHSSVNSSLVAMLSSL